MKETIYTAVIHRYGKEPVWIDNIVSYCVEGYCIRLCGTDFETFVGLDGNTHVTVTEAE